jgi:quercetin dioxygenase-like cupin family protein
MFPPSPDLLGGESAVVFGIFVASTGGRRYYQRYTREDTNMELIGNTLTLRDLVAYNEGAVVSKTLIDKKVGTVTMFSFGAGQGLSEHTVPYDAFVQIVDGEAEVTINGEPHTVSAGQMIIMPANIPHELKAVKPFKMLLVMIRS